MTILDRVKSAIGIKAAGGTYGGIMNFAKNLTRDGFNLPPQGIHNYRKSEGVEIPLYGDAQAMHHIWDISKASWVLTNTRKKIRQEIFRRGFSIEPKFVMICEDCGFEHQTEVEVCERRKPKSCGSTNLRGPDEEQRERVETFFKKVNKNGQTILDVFGEAQESGVDTFDDGWLLGYKKYQDVNGEDTSELKELFYGDPMLMKFVVNEDGTGRIGGVYWTCLHHRQDALLTRPSREEIESGCPECGRDLHEVFYVSTSLQSGSPLTYYFENEVIHWSYHSPSMTYGYPPPLALWDSLSILINMDNFVKTSYTNRESPDKLILMPSMNFESLEEMVEKLSEDVARNPHRLPIMPFDSGPNNPSPIVLSLLDSLKEMDAVSFTRLVTERIGSMYGVSQIFTNDVSVSGGLNNEGNQITVTGRTIEANQTIYNEKVFTTVLRWMGITDWIAFLLPSEEVDQAAEKERFTRDTTNMLNMLQGGYKSTFDPTAMDGPTGGFTYEKIPEEATPDAGLPNPEDEAIQLSFDKATKEKAKPSMSPHTQMTDETAEQVVQEDPFLDDTWDGWNRIQQNEAESIMLKGWTQEQGWSNKSIIDNWKKDISGIDQFTDEQLERIIRTEGSSVLNKAKEVEFEAKEEERGEKFRYKWSGANDIRTTDICKAIEDEVNEKGKGKGVPLEELKQIIKKHADPNIEFRDYVPHINCRRSISRVL